MIAVPSGTEGKNSTSMSEMETGGLSIALIQAPHAARALIPPGNP